jgi:hypothetical protein
LAEADDRPDQKPSTTGAPERRRPVTLDLSAKEVGRKQGAETSPGSDTADAARPPSSAPSGDKSKQAPGDTPIPSAFAPGSGAGKPADAGTAASSGNRRSTASLIAGFFLAAVLGGALAVGAFYVLGRQGIAPFAADNEATEAAIAETREAIESLSADVAGTPRDMGTLREELATLQSAVEGLRAEGTGREDALDSIAALQARIDALEASPENAGTADLADRVEALAGEVETISAAAGQGAGGADLSPRLDEIAGRVDALEARPAPDIAALEMRIEDISARLDAVQSEAAELAAATARIDALALHAAVADATLAFEEGTPFAPELEALTALGADPALVESLRPYSEAGLPQPAALAAQFDQALAALPGETPAPAASGTVDRLLASARGLVEVRRAGAPAALADAAEKVRAHLAAGDYSGALEAWGTLPQDAQAATRSFADALRARIDAEAALDKLRDTALVAISGRSG